MDKNVDFEISALYDVIMNKIRDQQARIASRIGNYKTTDTSGRSIVDKTFDKLDYEHDKSDQAHLMNASRVLSSLDSQVKHFSSDNKELISLIDGIKKLPLLDAEGLANQRIIASLRKDFSEVRNNLRAQIETSIGEVVGELQSVSSSMHLYYGGSAERNTALRATYPQTVHETVQVTLKKLTDLYRSKIDGYQHIQSSTQQLETSSTEVKTIEEYEKMIQENKIEIQPKRKMFFIKQNPLVAIANAKKAAIEKAHAQQVLMTLSALNVPSSYINTNETIDKLKAEYQKIVMDAEKKLREVDFENINNQVQKVHQEEMENQAYQDALKQAEELGYQLEKARSLENQELESQIVAQISMLAISEKDKEFYVSQGQQRFKSEELQKKDQAQIIREGINQENELEKAESKALYDEAKRQLEAEGILDSSYEQNGLDVKNSMDSKEMENLIRERMTIIMAQNRAINKQEELDYRSMTPEQVTVEFLKATGSLPENVTVQEAEQNPDFYSILNSVRGGADLTDEINAAKARKEQRQNRAYKLFKIEKSKYDALSESRRQQIVGYMSLIQELDDTKVKSRMDYTALQRQINYELQDLEKAEEMENGGRHL